MQEALFGADRGDESVRLVVLTIRRSCFARIWDANRCLANRPL